MAKLIGTFRDLPHKLHLSGGGKAKASDKQLRQYREFFDIGELCKIGFPDNATTLAHDSQLSLLAIGTKAGEIHVFGAPGHEYFACHKEACEVRQLLFLPEEGRLVSLTSDNRIHKWELNSADTANANWRLDHVADLLAGPADGADGQTAAHLALVGADRLWVGYASGSVRQLDAKEWKFAEAATSGDAIAKGLNEEASSQIHGWGSIVAMEASGKHVAVGFSSGTVAILNAADCSLHSVAPGSGEVTCLSWQTDGAALYTGHADGSYAVWRADQPAEASRLLKTADNPQTVYGPFPCLPVTRLLHRTAKLGAFTVLAGGMAKNTHADRHTVTLLREQEHVCLDLCSPVVDLTLLCSPGDGNTGQVGYDEPHTLLVLCESQLVAIDLYGAQWPEYRVPYLTGITATGAQVTSARLYGPGAASDQLRAALLQAGSGAGDSSPAFSSRTWPITGGKSLTAAAAVDPSTEAPAMPEGSAAATSGETAGEAASWDLLVTGHEDGSLAFWQVGASDSGTSASLLYSLHTAELFADAPQGAEMPHVETGGFPPFRAAGHRWQRAAAPSDEDEGHRGRFAVTAIELAGDSILVGGAGGQATLWRLAASDSAAAVEVDVRTVNADIVPPPGKDSRYSWEGPSPLRVREDPWHPTASRRLFEPATVALAFPPDRVCSLALDAANGLAALGTGFGLALLDTAANRCLTTYCTLPQDPASASGTSSAALPATPAKSAGASAPSSAGSSITKSLRQSFRRLKKLRGGKRQEYTVTAEEGAAAGPSTSATAVEATEAAAVEASPSADKKKKDKDKKDKKDKKSDKKEDKKVEEKEKSEKKIEEKKTEEKKTEEKKEETHEEAEKKAEENAEEEKKAEDGDAKAEAVTAEAAEEPAGAAAAAAAVPEAAAIEQPQKQALTPEVAAESPGRVRCLLIADCHLFAAGASTPALFAGDRAGRVYAFPVDTGAEKHARLAKELHLRHGAPVVAMHVTGEQQQLVVASEQQVKLFALPRLRPLCKARLLLAEAPARLRACGLAQFRSSSQQLSGLTVEDSLGRLLVLGLPQLKILAQLDKADPAAAAGCLAFQSGSVTNPLAVAVAGRARVRIVRLAAPVAAVAGKTRRYVEAAGLDLPDWARPVKAAAAPAAASSSPVVAAAATESASVEASPAAGAAAEGEQEQDHEQDHETDRSHHQVVADITMDDIKEYVAANPLPPTETIPESTDEKLETAAVTVAAASSDEAVAASDELAAAEEKKPEATPESVKPTSEAESATPHEKLQHLAEAEPTPAPRPAEAGGESLQPAEVKAFACEVTPAAAAGAGDVTAEQ